MARIGFVGLGKIGLPMAQDLSKAGHSVTGFDMVRGSVDKLTAANGAAASDVAAAVKNAEVLITMLPAGQHVREVYLGANGVLANARPGTLLIDSSTIDVDTARVVAKAAEAKGLAMLD